MLLSIVLLMPLSGLAGDDMGMILSAGVDKKLSKKWNVGSELEFRSRNDFRTVDRWALSVTGGYKVTSWLKAQVGYYLLYNNNRESITYNLDGSLNNWRPSYYGIRHRFIIQMVGSYKVGRFDFALRERWQHTYRPEKETDRYDFDNDWWETTTVRSKNKGLLRSRLLVEYDIPKSKFTPFASAEMFNGMKLERMRYHVGVDYALKKKHQFELYYRYQHDKGDEAVTDRHMIGVGYKFKF